MEIEFTVNGHPWEKGNPKPYIIWGQDIETPDGEKAKSKTFASQRYESEPLRHWHNAVRDAANDVMFREPRLMKGFVGICTVFHIQRPEAHYNSYGDVNSDHAIDLPGGKYTTTNRLHRAVIEALEGIVYFERTQIVQEACLKRYGDKGHAEIKIWNIAPHKIYGSPEQLDFGFEL